MKKILLLLIILTLANIVFAVENEPVNSIPEDFKTSYSIDESKQVECYFETRTTTNDYYSINTGLSACKSINAETAEEIFGEINCEQEDVERGICGWSSLYGGAHYTIEYGVKSTFEHKIFSENEFDGSVKIEYQNDKEEISETIEGCPLTHYIEKNTQIRKSCRNIEEQKEKTNPADEQKEETTPEDEQTEEETEKETTQELNCEGYLTALVDKYQLGFFNWNPEYDEINNEYPGCEDSEELLLSVSYFKNTLRLNQLERTTFKEFTQLGSLGKLSLVELNKKLNTPIESSEYAKVENYLSDRWWAGNLDKDFEENLANIYFLNKQDKLTWGPDLQNKTIVNVLKDIANELGDDKELEELSADELRLYIQTEKEEFYNAEFTENIDKRFEQVKVIKEELADSILRTEVINQLKELNYITLVQSEDKLLTSRQTLYKYSKINQALEIVETLERTNGCYELNNARQGQPVEKCLNAVKVIKNEA